MSNPDIQLETGSDRGWETKKGEEVLQSVAESHVLAFSLQRSRERWLTSVLPKFSSKVKKGFKAGSDTSSPPPHSLHLRGKCEVQIGPHIFPNTTFYEAIYLPTYHSNQGLISTSYASTTPSALEPTMATPALIDQINAAAATNPILASLLQLANAGQATPDQLHMLSITIRSLAANPLPASQYSSLNAQNSSALSTTPESNKEFDLVIEFEASSNRFIFPRGTTVCERVSGSEDIVVTSYIQLQNSSSMQKITEESQGQSSSQYRMLRLSLHGASESLWDSLNRWAGGEDIMNANRKTLNQLKGKQPRKTYLAYRLPEGLLLDHIKAAVSAPYPMKALKPPASLLKSRRIRKPVTKTPQELERSSLDTQTNAKPPRRKRSAAELNAALDLAAAITGAGSVANYSLTQSSHSSALPTPSALTDTSTHAAPPPPKKRKQRTTLKSEYQSQPAATEIKCRSCQATDVPLMLGGRFCRPCVEAGRGIADIPQLPNYTRAPQASAYTPKYILPPLPLPPMATHHFTLMDPTSRYPSATISGPRPDVVASYALNNIHSGTLATPNLTTMTNIPTNQSTPPNVEN
ncbi:uncharacterized protein C8R40DRAFT_1164332 [Lentinula edodes]|uniref:uncharacterized protein n=1 Tax=Lentinula edodes TaxID=5353 RepID=UPI001E8E16C1|nr:uncharacterized protein C8R40DRAFT_1164332 [Lentinula edodes]KAH7880894.1 hypothetical protein C8R40DRAFT_1164332 [Lentinula edodes]